MAGLTVARVLADHFDHVTVIERDEIPSAADPRKGVPQGRHPHALLLRGLMILEQLFPGLTQDLHDAGAVPFDLGSETRWTVADRMRVSYKSDLIVTACSRPLVEHVLYRRMLAHPKVRFISRSQAIGLTTDARSVTGVRVRAREEHRLDAAIQTIAADLVVDSSGRDSEAPAWLAALGFTPPRETVISAKPGYATRIYQRPDYMPPDAKLLYIQTAPPHNTRGGIAIPMEGNCWHVTMMGMNGDYPPTDEQGFIEFARSLPHPVIYDAIKHAEPLSPVVGYRRLENRERHYDELPRYLEGFVVTGDAARAFNPVYGQGMTVAAMGSTILDQCLREHRELHGADTLAGLAQRFQTQLVTLTAGPWQLSTGEDLRWAALRGEYVIDPATALAQRYIDQVLKVSVTVPAVADVFYRVLQLLEEPTLFFRPDIVLTVFDSLATTQPELRQAA
jgi:2-polyprenyl-6-methoxyphenol hydroxylase-like FAD-dependent oxidoreductase